MLIEIASDRFRTSPIALHPSLNVILGDENATNSIGKSTLLMVVDFGFGGRTLLDHNIDLVGELGHHDYFFSFMFDDEKYIFRRGTYEPSIVYRCDATLAAVGALSVEQYTSFLKEAYAVGLDDITFRALVGLYFRVWGKDNLDVRRPLHAASQQSAKECVTNLIKTFALYGDIRELSEDLAEKEARLAALTAATKHEVVPKIGKRDYSDNTQRIEALEGELSEIRENLAKYATNLSEIVNKDVLELKFGKDALLNIRLALASRLMRTRQNIQENRHIKSRHFAGLKEFFPQINEARLATVEEFHSGIAKALRGELREAESDLVRQLDRVDVEIGSLDARMAKALTSIEQPSIIVDRVVHVARALKTARDENKRFDEEIELRDDVASLKVAFSTAKKSALIFIESVVNDGVRRIVTEVFGEERKSPELSLTDTNYSYEVFDDTGTGTAYASMIVFDLAIFGATPLPVLAHDSLLYKNIENDSAAKLFEIYANQTKQSFLAIDEISKYGQGTASLLMKQSVIQLDDSNVLYTKDWRQKA